MNSGSMTSAAAPAATSHRTDSRQQTSRWRVRRTKDRPDRAPRCFQRRHDETFARSHAWGEEPRLGSTIRSTLRPRASEGQAGQVSPDGWPTMSHGRDDTSKSAGESGPPPAFAPSEGAATAPRQTQQCRSQANALASSGSVPGSSRPQPTPTLSHTAIPGLAWPVLSLDNDPTRLTIVVTLRASRQYSSTFPTFA